MWSHFVTFFFFTDKIDRIHAAVDSVPVINFDLNHDTDLEQYTTTTLDYFKETSETEVGKMIKSSKSATLSLDPLPTEIIKKTSSAHIAALILANYRPVSNLPFTAKVMESIAVQWHSEHLTPDGLHEELQSAYKPLHCTETALMRVQHDIANETDTNLAALLVLLDMFTAFDTIDATILIDTLHNRFGVNNSDD